MRCGVTRGQATVIFGAFIFTNEHNDSILCINVHAHYGCAFSRP